MRELGAFVLLLLVVWLSAPSLTWSALRFALITGAAIVLAVWLVGVLAS
jgi:hypothetical protein